MSKRQARFLSSLFPIIAAVWVRPETGFLTLDAPDTGANQGGGNAGANPPAGGNAGAGTGEQEGEEGEEESEGTEGTDQQGGGNPPARPQADPKVQNAIKRRKKASFLARAIADAAGIDIDELEVRETRDKNRPFEIVGLNEQLEGKQRNSGDNSGAGKNKNQRTNPQVERLKRERQALIEWIRQNVVAANIRAACVKHGAVDDDGGQFEDIVNLVLPQFVCNVEFEEGANAPEVSTYAVDSDGEPIPDVTEDQLVSDLLRRKPKFRKPDFRAGPGAGGNVVGNNNQRRNGTPGVLVGSGANGNRGASGVPKHIESAGKQFFGRG